MAGLVSRDRRWCQARATPAAAPKGQVPPTGVPLHPPSILALEPSLNPQHPPNPRHP
jgi:hypothetical protein